MNNTVNSGTDSTDLILANACYMISLLLEWLFHRVSILLIALAGFFTFKLNRSSLEKGEPQDRDRKRWVGG